MTELVQYREASILGEQMEFARAVVARPEGGAASLLPQAYRDNPGNVLLAVGLGQSMGLSPAESLYRIDVIQGKPTASAELIASNVRKAGHKLRVETDEQAMRVTCTIIRADDPDFPHVVVRDMEWAKRMGLVAKDNYKKQPVTMLEWRAISACARKACSEALYGVQYTADEMYDAPPASTGGGLAAALRPSVSAEQVEPEPPNISESVEMVTPAQIKKIGAAMTQLGLKDRAVALEYVGTIVGRPVPSRNDLTKDEAMTLIDALEADIADAANDDPDADYAAAIGQPTSPDAA